MEWEWIWLRGGRRWLHFPSHKVCGACLLFPNTYQEYATSPVRHLCTDNWCIRKLWDSVMVPASLTESGKYARKNIPPSPSNFSAQMGENWKHGLGRCHHRYVNIPNFSKGNTRSYNFKLKKTKLQPVLSEDLLGNILVLCSKYACC